MILSGSSGIKSGEMQGPAHAAIHIEMREN